MSNLCLQGLRILDLSHFWAGPVAAELLGDLGAEVIKVESCRRPDMIRIAARGVYPEGILGERPWNRSGMFIERNRNKFGITLDLSRLGGKRIFKQLVKVSDVVLENFRYGVMEKLGLDYGVLKDVNPQIIMISMSSRGATGPDRETISFGNLLEAESGMASLTGYSNSLRLFGSLFLPDPISAVVGAGAILAGLHYRKKSRKGLFIDVSQLEVASSVIGEAFLQYSMNQILPDPLGNRSSFMAPHGCYPCKGQDKWVTIAVRSDEEWRKLCEVINKPSLAEDTSFAKVKDRLRHQDELDEIISAWTRQLAVSEITAKLQEQRIAAGPVFSIKEVFRDPHLKQRAFWHTYKQPGEVSPYPYRGIPIKLSKVPFSVRLPAPKLGEHNFLIFNKLLHLSKQEIEELKK